MTKLLRLSFVIFAIPLIALAIGLLCQNQWLDRRWLWPHAPWVSYFFMASLFLANGIALLFCAFKKEIRSIVPVAVGSLVCFIGCGLYLLLQAHGSDQTYNQARLNWGNLSIFYAIYYALVCLACWRLPFNKHAKKLPMSLRFILGFIVAANLWVGLRLLGVEDAFAWKVTPEMAVVYGWGLVGAATFTAMVLLEPFWENIGPLFAAFVFYNLTLFYPVCYLLIYPNNLPTTFHRTLVFLILLILTLFMVIAYSFYYQFKISKLDQ